MPIILLSTPFGDHCLTYLTSEGNWTRPEVGTNTDIGVTRHVLSSESTGTGPPETGGIGAGRGDENLYQTNDRIEV